MCLLPVVLSAAIAGEIHGRIVITKVLTKPRVTITAYEQRGAAPKREEPSALNEFSRVVVYVDAPAETLPVPVRAVLNQRNQRFDPEFLVVPIGSSVDFPNNDPFFHNVFSLSRAKSLDLGYYPAGQSRTVRFDKAGVVQVYCHLHPNMTAAIVVAPNAWHTQPDEAGRFALPRLKPGRTKLVAWHRSAGFFEKTVEVPETGVSRVDFEIPVRVQEDKRR